MDYVQRYLKDKGLNKTKLMTLEETQLTRLICAAFDVPDIIKPCRLRPNVDSRKVYARILKDRGWNLCQIGRSLHRDHSTIHHYLKDFEWLLIHDPKVRDHYLAIKGDLDRTLHTDPLYSLEDEALVARIHELREEKAFLISALKRLQSEFDKEKKYGDIFASICSRVPANKIDEFSIKLNRILNGI